jgi:hypothetical protein
LQRWQWRCLFRIKKMIILRNRGEIDINVMKIMGVSAKDCESPIGKFGTGLKYAIAVFLREGIDICMFIGKNRYDFFTEPQTIRGKVFNLCKIKGPYDVVELPFTTDLGSGWAPWMGYREFRSNCIDEDGEELTGEQARGEEGCTTFCIGDIDTRAVFLQDMELPLLHRGDQIEIYRGESEFIYYRGIRAKNLQRSSMYTYNILRECDLTEDRLLCYDFEIEYAINQTIAQMPDKAIIKSVIAAGPGCFESTLNMLSNTGMAPKAAFKEAFNECSNKASSSVRDYVLHHAPKAPPTPAQLRLTMLSDLRSLCSRYGLDHVVDLDNIRITGELIEATEA